MGLFFSSFNAIRVILNFLSKNSFMVRPPGISWTRLCARTPRMSGEDIRARHLTTIPGVGYYIALLLVAEIGDINRFPDSKTLCNYAGLVPSVWRSGGSTWHGGITRDGSKWMRRALTQAVHITSATRQTSPGSTAGWRGGSPSR